MNRLRSGTAASVRLLFGVIGRVSHALIALEGYVPHGVESARQLRIDEAGKDGQVSVSRLKNISMIGVEQMGSLADSLADPDLLRLENLDTDMRPPDAAVAFTKRAVDDDAANSYAGKRSRAQL
jgi:hypothetical protein